MKSLRPVTDAILEAHLMTIQPERKIEDFAQAGADFKAGVALNPATPLCMVEELLYDVDVVLLMTAIPGAAGQPCA